MTTLDDVGDRAREAEERLLQDALAVAAWQFNGEAKLETGVGVGLCPVVGCHFFNPRDPTHVAEAEKFLAQRHLFAEYTAALREVLSQRMPALVLVLSVDPQYGLALGRLLPLDAVVQALAIVARATDPARFVPHHSSVEEPS